MSSKASTLLVDKWKADWFTMTNGDLSIVWTLPLSYHTGLHVVA